MVWIFTRRGEGTEDGCRQLCRLRFVLLFVGADLVFNVVERTANEGIDAFMFIYVSETLWSPLLLFPFSTFVAFRGGANSNTVLFSSPRNVCVVVCVCVLFADQNR